MRMLKQSLPKKKQHNATWKCLMEQKINKKNAENLVTEITDTVRKILILRHRM